MRGEPLHTWTDETSSSEGKGPCCAFKQEAAKTLLQKQGNVVWGVFF